MRQFTQKLLVGLILLVLTPSLVQAQQGGVEGAVTDAETGEPLPGATVQIPELGIGTATDTNGMYELSVPEGTHLLQVSFVGYETSEQEIQVQAGATVTADVALQSSAEQLGELVVTALGIEQEERSLGYSTTEVSGEDMVEAAEPNLTNALSGQVPGLQVSMSSGQPGKSSRITIRGNSSYQAGGNQPLIVVDGMPISNAEDDNPTGPTVFTGGTSNRLVDIDPNSIASINVLKGASATALYGSRAANGAIIIETKGGGEAPGVRATYTASVGFSDAIIEGYQDEYLQGLDGAYRNGLAPGRGGYNEAADPDSPNFNPNADPQNTQTTNNWGPHKDSLSQAAIDAVGQPAIVDPREQFYERGTRIENSVSISGSGDFGNANLTITDTRNDGTVPTTQLNKTSVQAKYGVNLTDALGVQVSSQYTDTNQDFMLEANGPNAYQWSLQFAPINFDLKQTEFEDGAQRSFSVWDNPLWLTDNMNYFSDVSRFVGNVEVDYELFGWLTLKERIGVDTYTDTRKEQVNVGTATEPGGRLFDQSITRSEVNSDFTITATRDITEDLALDLIVGNNISRRTFSDNFISGVGLGVPDFYNISNASSSDQDEFSSEQVVIGAFANGTLNYRDHTYLTLTARNDWSSTLPQANNSYFYPSASLSFVFTEAFNDVFEGTPLNFGRIRGSLAQVGSDTDPYELQTTFIQAAPGDGVRGDITFPFRGQNGFYLENTQANPELRPEITTEYEFGTELRFFSGRAILDVTYYNRKTEDQIFDVPVSSTTGFTTQNRNAGEIQNRGWELDLSGTPLQVGDLSWDLGVNWSKNTTEVLELAEGVENIFLFGFTSPQIRAEVGEDGYGVIFASRYLRNGDISEENPVEINGEERTAPVSGFGDDALLIAEDGTPVEDPAPGNIGNVQPDWQAGIQSTFSWKGLSLSQQWEIIQGGDILNFDRFYMEAAGTHIDTEDRGQEYTFDGLNVSTGSANETSIIRDFGWYNGPDRLVFERFVEDASYVKLRQLSLSYRLPVPGSIQDAGLRSLRLSLTGRNLLTFTDFSMGDPAGSLAGAGNGQGFYHGVTPTSRTYQASVQFGF